MRRGSLSRHVEGIAFKRLRAVETDPGTSNQHEINGVAALRHLLGAERLTRFPARFVFLGDDDTVTADAALTWYDSRENVAHRAAEWRLYFTDNPAMQRASAGDLIVCARLRGGAFVALIAPSGGAMEADLSWLFGLGPDQGRFAFAGIEGARDRDLGLVARQILEEIGVEPEAPEDDRLDALVARFGLTFPPTAELSRLARETAEAPSPLEDPDAALLAWLDWEEALFRRLEARLVSDRLRKGFVTAGEADVDAFVAFSLSVQNRRKSRMGFALGHHVEAILRAHALPHTREARTEPGARPDFLFPSEAAYRDPAFPPARLDMLACKSSLKDRWRQVLAEAERIPAKHLLTLRPALSAGQAEEMARHALALVLPAGTDAARPAAPPGASPRPVTLSLADFLARRRAAG